MDTPPLPDSPPEAAQKGQDKSIPLTQTSRPSQTIYEPRAKKTGGFGRHTYRHVGPSTPPRNLAIGNMVQNRDVDVFNTSNHLKQTRLPSGLTWKSHFADMNALALQRGISQDTISNEYQFRLKEAARADKSRYWGDCPLEVQQAAAESETWKHFFFHEPHYPGIEPSVLRAQWRQNLEQSPQETHRPNLERAGLIPISVTYGLESLSLGLTEAIPQTQPPFSGDSRILNWMDNLPPIESLTQEASHGQTSNLSSLENTNIHDRHNPQARTRQRQNRRRRQPVPNAALFNPALNMSQHQGPGAQLQHPAQVQILKRPQPVKLDVSPYIATARRVTPSATAQVSEKTATG